MTSLLLTGIRMHKDFEPFNKWIIFKFFRGRTYLIFVYFKCFIPKIYFFFFKENKSIIFNINNNKNSSTNKSIIQKKADYD